MSRGLAQEVGRGLFDCGTIRTGSLCGKEVRERRIQERTGCGWDISESSQEPRAAPCILSTTCWAACACGTWLSPGKPNFVPILTGG